MESKINGSPLKNCLLCRRSDDNDLLYGKFHHRPTLSVHENCLLFTSGLEQRAKKTRNSILRFLLSDIKQEASRGKRLKCCYCRKIGATVGCILKTCKKSFHFPCGVKYRTLHQYFGNFSSYCDQHKPRQKDVQVEDELYCYICCNSISKEELQDCLYSPCCKNNWFHHVCLKHYAKSAGSHFFKCPLCNNTSDFVKEMQHFGIYIPEKDADWELEENAFGDLLFRPECDPTTCQCSKGRKHDGLGDWRLLPCSLCGGRATHTKCGGLSGVNSWICKECEVIQAKIEEDKKETERVENSTKLYNLALIQSIAKDLGISIESSSFLFSNNPGVLQELLRRKPIVTIKKEDTIPFNG